MYSLIEEYNKCFSTKCKTISGILTDVFNMGLTYGLLKAEEERESEAAFDSAICYLTDEKFQSPSIPTKKRQPHKKGKEKSIVVPVCDDCKLYVVSLITEEEVE